MVSDKTWSEGDPSTQRINAVATEMGLTTTSYWFQLIDWVTVLILNQ